MSPEFSSKALIDENYFSEIWRQRPSLKKEREDENNDVTLMVLEGLSKSEVQTDSDSKENTEQNSPDLQ